jgi:hypothetical protein
LAEGIFEEINNVLDVNRLLASGDHSFVFGDDIYYRVYAERQHVEPKEETFDLLARTALLRLYGPSLFWLLRLPPVRVAGIIRAVLENPRSSNIHLVCRLAVLLGPKATVWLKETLERCWRSHPQPPEHHFSFKKMVSSIGKADLRLVALQQSANAKILLLGDTRPVLASDLLSNPQRTANLLSKACMAVFKGDHSHRQSCRQLDVYAYGGEMLRMGDQVADELSHNG